MEADDSGDRPRRWWSEIDQMRDRGRASGGSLAGAALIHRSREDESPVRFAMIFPWRTKSNV